MRIRPDFIGSVIVPVGDTYVLLYAGDEVPDGARVDATHTTEPQTVAVVPEKVEPVQVPVEVEAKTNNTSGLNKPARRRKGEVA